MQIRSSVLIESQTDRDVLGLYVSKYVLKEFEEVEWSDTLFINYRLINDAIIYLTPTISIQYSILCYSYSRIQVCLRNYMANVILICLLCRVIYFLFTIYEKSIDDCIDYKAHNTAHNEQSLLFIK